MVSNRFYLPGGPWGGGVGVSGEVSEDEFNAYNAKQAENASLLAAAPSQQTVGPGRGLQFKTIDDAAVSKEAQIQGAPTFSKLRRALLQTSTIAANEDNPAKKREMLRAAMEGTGMGFSDVSLAAHNAALNKVSKDTDIENRGLELEYQAGQAAQAQSRGIASQEKMQGLSLAEARAAQAAGISAQQVMQDKSILAAQGAQLTGITSSEKMQGIGISAAERQAQLNREYETSTRLSDTRNTIAAAAFNAEMARANAESAKASPMGWVEKPGTGKWWEPLTSQEEKNRQWQVSYDRAIKNFYAKP